MELDVEVLEECDLANDGKRQWVIVVLGQIFQATRNGLHRGSAPDNRWR